MSSPVAIVSRSTIKQGEAQKVRRHCADAVALVESEEPEVIGFQLYTSVDDDELIVLQVHPDADSLASHMQMYFERLAANVTDAIETTEVDVFGQPSDVTLAMLEQMRSWNPGLQVRISPNHTAGLMRAPV